MEKHQRIHTAFICWEYDSSKPFGGDGPAPYLWLVIDRRAAAALVQEMACLKVMTTPQRNIETFYNNLKIHPEKERKWYGIFLLLIDQ